MQARLVGFPTSPSKLRDTCEYPRLIVFYQCDGWFLGDLAQGLHCEPGEGTGRDFLKLDAGLCGRRGLRPSMPDAPRRR
jgi:hypothetical protein